MAMLLDDLSLSDQIGNTFAVAQSVRINSAKFPFSSVLNISTTTTQASADSLSWIETINLDSLKNVGITKSVLIRCRELYPAIPPEGLEELVSRFSVYVKEPKNRVQNARGFFISLAKQLSEGIVPLDHIEIKLRWSPLLETIRLRST